MISFSKLREIAITLFGVSLVAFFLVRFVPGDPVTLLLGERGGSPEVIAELKARYGLDQSLIQQYWIFVSSALEGDFGKSVVSGRDVWGEFTERFAATSELGLFALILAIAIGLPLGLLSALFRGTWFDRIAMAGSVVLYSMPIFWWALVAIALVSVRLALLPVSGRMSIEFDVPLASGFLLFDCWRLEDPAEALAAFQSAFRHLLLPAIVLSTVPLAVIARMTRSSLLEVLDQDYIRAARSRGYSVARVLVVHALRNALIPVLTVIGLLLGTLLTGAILTETVFSWPGLGRWLVTAVLARDYPVIQGGVLLVASLVLATSLLVEALTKALNPKLRDQNSLRSQRTWSRLTAGLSKAPRSETSDVR